MNKNVLNDLYATAARLPDKPAYCSDTVTLTFAEVLQRTESIATCLHMRGICKRPVVVFMRKSPMEITAFFGVIAGGDFYVPLDEEMPDSRIRLILENVKSPLVICDADTIEKARQFDLMGGELALYEELIHTEPDRAALDAIRRAAIDTDPIYIVFTSGSTGIPKGVAACHRSVLDYIEQLSEVLAFDEDTVFGNQAPLYFDACLKDVYSTIKFGATTWLIPQLVPHRAGRIPQRTQDQYHLLGRLGAHDGERAWHL